MPNVGATGRASATGRLTEEEWQELRNTFAMRGLMPREQARLLAHVQALEEELRALRGLQLSSYSHN